MKTTKLRKGQKVVCIHYKDRPVVKVIDIVEESEFHTGIEVWVKDAKGKQWWGSADWFKPLAKKNTARKVNKILNEHNANRALLCDSRVPGCSCCPISMCGRKI